MDNLTSDTYKLVVKCHEDALPFNSHAGQYATLKVDGLNKPRAYSFAKSPKSENKNEYTFFIRQVPGGEFSNWLAKNRTGEKIIISAPLGYFKLDDSKDDMVCIAGGSGLAPIKSLLEGGVIDQIKRDVVFLFGARTQDDLYCVKELEEIKKNWNQEFKFDFIPVLNMEPEDSDWNGGRGFVTDYFEENVIRKNNLDISDWQGYLCGPPPMVDAASSLLQKHGIKVDEIFYDKFTDSSNL